MLHCYAEKLPGGQWQAFCLEFCLAAQGDSFNEVRRKLIDQTKDYVFDAMAGKDKDFAFELLHRRAPLKYWLRFYYLLAVWKAKSALSHYKLAAVKDGVARLFCPPIPMVPAHHRP